MKPGTRQRGRPRRRWVYDVEEWTGLQMSAEVNKTRDRHCWRKEIYAVTPQLQFMKEKEKMR